MNSPRTEGGPMSISHIIDLAARLDDQQFEGLRLWVGMEDERRRADPGRQAAQAEVVASMRARGEIGGPDAGDADTPVGDLPAWVDPGTLHARMYLPGAIVTHNGRVWESTHPGLNSWQPGSEGVDYRIWRDITPQPEPEPDEPDALPSWNPQGHSYTVGDQFTYQGVTYRVVQSHTSAAHWTPDTVPSLYTVA